MFASTLLLLLTSPLAGSAPQDSDVNAWGERVEWPVELGPPAREHAAFVVDAERDRAILLAGSGYAPYGTPLGDAWSFDLEAGTWAELAWAGDELTPGGARRAAVVRRDAGSFGAFLHGGYGEGLVEIDGLWWVEPGEGEVRVRAIEQVNPPPARLLHAFACDPAGEQLVVFGGVGGDDGLDDTWIGRRAGEEIHWRELETADGPGPRFGFAFAYDAQLERLLVCGGQVPPGEGETDMIVAHDLWALDFPIPPDREAPAWTLLATYSPDELPGRRNPAFTFDNETGDLLVWGGTGDGVTAIPDLYVVRTRAEGAPVARIPQPEGVTARASCFGVVDPFRRRALLGFGNTGAGPLLDLVEVLLRDPSGD